jgi:hypothetical protein
VLIISCFKTTQYLSHVLESLMEFCGGVNSSNRCGFHAELFRVKPELRCSLASCKMHFWSSCSSYRSPSAQRKKSASVRRSTWLRKFAKYGLIFFIYLGWGMTGLQHLHRWSSNIQKYKKKFRQHAKFYVLWNLKHDLFHRNEKECKRKHKE